MTLHCFAPLLLSISLLSICQAGCAMSAGPAIPDPRDGFVKAPPPAAADVAPEEEVSSHISTGPIVFKGTYPGADEDTTLLLNWARTAAIPVFDGPSSDASVLGEVEVREGDVLEWTQTCVLVTEPYPLRAKQDRELETNAIQFEPATQEYTETSVALSVRSGDVVEFVKYTGEGECLIRVDGVIYSIFCPDWADFEGGGEDEKIQSKQRFWVRVSAGWVEVTGDQVRFSVQGP
jgi:hypothetical protein